MLLVGSLERHLACKDNICAIHLKESVLAQVEQEN